MSEAIKVPYDDDAERSVLGAMMLSRVAVERMVGTLVPEDFYGTKNRAVFAAIVELFRNGQAVDAVTVAAQLAEDGKLDFVGGRQAVHAINAYVPLSGNVDSYAEVVIERADRRRLMQIGDNMRSMSFDLDTDIDDVVTMVKEHLESVKRASGPKTFPAYEEWSQTIDMTERWLVPGLLERRDRLMLVAGEGAGKSLLLRQWALMVACGINWKTEATIVGPQRKVLVIDVENSDRQIVRHTRAMMQVARRKAPDFNPENFVVIPIATLDLTKRSDRMEIEAYLEGHQPDLIVIGPLYKILPPPGGRISYEEHALQGIHIIDDWRARYDIAVLMEHHAAKTSGGRREMDPLGASAWMRWPEFGIKIERDEENKKLFHLGHFRGQREIREWPATLEHGGPMQWPWRAPIEDRIPNPTDEQESMGFEPDEPF